MDMTGTNANRYLWHAMHLVILHVDQLISSQVSSAANDGHAHFH